MLYVYIVTTPNTEAPMVFMHATHVKASVRLSYCRTEHKPQMTLDKMERMEWSDGTVAVLTPVYEREEHL